MPLILCLSQRNIKILFRISEPSSSQDISNSLTASDCQSSSDDDDSVATIGQRNPVDTLDVSLLHIPRHPPGVEVRPFHMTSQSLVPDVNGPEDIKRIGSLRELHLVRNNILIYQNLGQGFRGPHISLIT